MSSPPPPAPAVEGDAAPRASLVLLVYAAAAVALTWPLAVASGTMPSTRPDALVNLWNSWWVREALWEQGLELWRTEHLHHHVGVELGRHTLSLVNSLPGSLLTFVAPAEDVFRWLTVAHYAFSGWTFYLLARYVTGRAGGALLAGVAWTFSPLHLYFVPQLNLSTLEFLPLLVLAMMKTWREGGLRNTLGVAACAALLATSASYYLVYGALLGFALLLGGRAWAPDVPWRRGAGRLLGAGGLSAAAVLVAAWPLVSAVTAGAPAPLSTEPKIGRWNDLLGFRWNGGVGEMPLVSWPTMLGWTTLAVLALGARGVLRLRGRGFWIVVALVAFVLGLGSELTIAGRPTGIPLPHAWIDALPVFSMLRAAQRMLLLVHLATGLLLAAAWGDVVARLASPTARRIATTVALLLFCAERNAAPVPAWPVPHSTALEQLAADDTIGTVVVMPFAKPGADAWRNLAQITHGKRQPGGYVTNLALTDDNIKVRNEWGGVSRTTERGSPIKLRTLVGLRDIDAVVLDKRPPGDEREPSLPDRLRVRWAPFCLLHDELVVGRLDEGPFVREAMEPERLALWTEALEEAYGAPVHEDERYAVYRAD